MKGAALHSQSYILTHLAHYILLQNSSVDPNKFGLSKIRASFDQMWDY